MTRRGPRLAIVHDWMTTPGGAERVVHALHRMWPTAPIYTASYVPERFPEFADADVRPLWLDRIGLAKRKHQLFSIPRAWAFRRLDLSPFDVVISSSSAEAKYVRTGSRTLHVSYCHTPIRYYWRDYEWYRQHPPFGPLNPLVRAVLPLLIGRLRKQDFEAAQQVDAFIANSRNVRHRIAEHYRRDAMVIHPPIDTARFRVADRVDDYYLVVGRQVAYKRLDVAVDAFNELGLPLLVAGAGEESAAQQARSRPNIRFLGRVPEDELPDLYARARALVFPPEEDFGMVPIEAMASGRPVIAYGKGGALETVVEGVTGLFFPEQTPAALVDAVRRFEGVAFDPEAIRRHALAFDTAVFEREMRALVERELGTPLP